jgi:hypothetical protein
VLTRIEQLWCRQIIEQQQALTLAAWSLAPIGEMLKALWCSDRAKWRKQEEGLKITFAV